MLARKASRVLRRQPMVDTTSTRGNAHLSSRHDSGAQADASKPSAPRPELPHHESLLPGGNLLMPPHDSSDTPELPQNKHLSVAVDEHANDQNRLSQASEESFGRPIKYRVGPWQLGKSLGHGMSGNVRKARHLETGEEVAAKIVSLKQAAKIQTQSIMNLDEARKVDFSASRESTVPMALQRECAILKTINHPQIIRLKDVWENRGDLYIFTDLVEGGELFEYIREGQLPEWECIRIFRQIITALSYCHRLRVCHRDLKPENILMDLDMNVKLADFGMAAMQLDNPLQTSCGSPHYAAPEVCSGLSYNGEKTDIWSAGVILYVMLFGQLPFGQNCGINEIGKIVHEVKHKPITFPRNCEHVSDEAKNFCRRILQRDPAKRMTIKQMWDHPFLTAFNDYARLPMNQKTWLGGPLPSLTKDDYGETIKDRRDIDYDLLENMCALWQTDNEEQIIAALLSPKESTEKMLYTALLNFRNHQEETYNGPGISSSASDYHHVAPKPLQIQKSATKSSLLGAATGPPKSKSRMSVVPSSQRQQSTASHGSHETHRTGSVAATEKTYDPYRSSKPQFAYDGDPYTKVDVLRGGSVVSKGSENKQGYRPSKHKSVRGPPPVTRRQQHKRPPSSVWESTVASSSVTSMPSSPPRTRDHAGNTRTLRHTGPAKRTLSTSSIATTVVSTSGVRFARSQSYRRNVSFKFQRMHSTPSNLSIAQLALPTHKKEFTLIHSNSGYVPPLPGHCDADFQDVEDADADEDDRTAQNDTYVKHRRSMVKDYHKREAAVTERHSLPNKSTNPNDTLKNISRTIKSTSGTREMLRTPDDAAAVAGSEFSQFCDEHWGPSPVPIAFQNRPPMTPNQILAARLNFASRKAIDPAKAREELRNRPLPEPPYREPHAFQMQRSLHKALLEVKEKSKGLEPGMVDGVLDQLQRLMRENAPNVIRENRERRIASAPLPYNTLPPMIEENDGIEGRRHVSDPTHSRLFEGQATQPEYDGPTILLVNPSPRPLGMPQTSYTQPMHGGLAAGVSDRTTEPRVVPSRKASREFQNSRQDDTKSSTPVRDSAFIDDRLQTITEDQDQQGAGEVKRSSNGSGRLKKLWIRSSKSLEKTNPGNSRPQSGQAQTQPQPVREPNPTTPFMVNHDYPERQPSDVEIWQAGVQHALAEQPPMQSYQGTFTSEFPSRGKGNHAARIPTEKTSLSFWERMNFFRRPKVNRMTVVEQESIYSVANSTTTSLHRSHMGRPTYWDEMNPLAALFARQKKQSKATKLFERWFQVKPAEAYFAFRIDKLTAMKVIKCTLKSWKDLGVKDIVVEKKKGIIYARLDENNALGVKPLEIRILVNVMIFTENKYNHKASGFSIARMEQVRGSKTSFQQCANQLRATCRRRGALVTDPEQAKEMKGIFAEFLKNEGGDR